MMFYAPSTKGFYENSPTLPSDAIELTDEQYAALRDGQDTNTEIVVVEGVPVLSTRVITPEETKYRNENRVRAQLAAIDAKKIRAVTDAMLNGDTTRLADLERQAIILRGQLAGV